MSYEINDTHDPNLRSWVESANDPNTDFPIQNLPLGMFIRKGKQEGPQYGVAIGEYVLDLRVCEAAGLFESMSVKSPWWRYWHPSVAWSSARSQLLRRRLVELLHFESKEIRETGKRFTSKVLVPMQDIELQIPVSIGDYTDFYSSIHHATNVGKLFRPDQPLMPNYKWVPIGYHGRASSIVTSGTAIRRPAGQLQEGDAPPTFGPSRVLDYELEVGFFIGVGNAQGEQIPITEAEQHIFGLCLVNDWSARDIQRWEYQPLGPFLSKSFATSISPWIVTMEALAPFRVPAFERAADDPQPLPYLDSAANQQQGGFDIKLEVLLQTEQMRQQNLAPHRISTSNTRDLYWTLAQLLTHHASNGCNLRPGDLIASGTVSGPNKENQGCLLELTERGAKPIQLPNGETRKFLQDGDEVILRGYCERDGFRRIGLGECRGVITGTADAHRQ